MKLGAHMSAAGGLYQAVARAQAAGCDSLQVFVKNNKQWFAKPPGAEDCARFTEACRASGIKKTLGHAGYLINLAGPASATRDNSIKSLIQEIEHATAYGLPFLVLHPGAHLGLGEEQGIAQAVAGLDEVFAATKTSPVRIALENTAGQGTCLGHRIAHLAAIFDAVRQPKRLGVCLDTAHFFAAGYDIRTPRGWDQAIKEVADLIGLRPILAFHLNDSKTGLGSRVDRHEHIGKGEIGREGFRHVVNDARFKKSSRLPGNPKSEDLREDVENLQVLRSLLRPESDRVRARCSRRTSDSLTLG